MDTLPHDDCPRPEGALGLADLIDEIDKHLRYYVELPSPPLSVLVTCWIVNTYVHECFDYCPYLVLHSSGPGAGKTVVLDFLSMLAFGNPQIITDPSAASLYRCASKVLLLDEMERLGSKDKALRGNYIEILNSGFKKSVCSIVVAWQHLSPAGLVVLHLKLKLKGGYGTIGKSPISRSPPSLVTIIDFI